jgi:formylglycine-generating enzyme required for sulfatase activity
MMMTMQHAARVLLGASLLLAALTSCDMEPPRGNAYDPANDTGGPHVVSTVPADGDRGMAVSQVITASFSEGINELSVDHTSFVVLDRNGDYVYGKITCDGAIITFEPHVPLNSAQIYRVVITTAVTDYALNAMSAQYEWSFQTEIHFEPEMVPVAGGTYVRGSDLIAGIIATESEYLNGPAHEVELSGFEIGKYEVTVEEYAEYCRAAGIPTPAAPFGGGRMPVVYVSWYDAVKYCNWLSEIKGYTRCYSTTDNINYECDFTANGYRLPTEAEWEFAARNRGATPAEQYSGYASDRDMNLYVIYRGNTRGGTELVDNIAPNDLGLYHMSGNVREWCWDFNEYWIWTYDMNSKGQLNELKSTFCYKICYDYNEANTPLYVKDPVGYVRLPYAARHFSIREDYWPLSFSMRGGGWSDTWDGDDLTEVSPLRTGVRSDDDRSCVDLPTRRRDNVGFRICRTHVE